MAKFIVDQARLISAKAQKRRNTCWLTCFEMLLQGSNIPSEYCTRAAIESRLKKGGIDVTTAKSQGLLDADFPKACKALKMKCSQPNDVSTINGLYTQLYLRGALWLAVKITGSQSDFHHVVLVLGVDVDKERMYYIDPWQDSVFDTVKKKWVSYTAMKKAILGTSGQVAGCQSVKWDTLR